MVFFGAMLDLTRKLKQAHHHRSIIHVNAYFNCEGNFHVGSLSGQQSSFFFFFFFALSRCKHCFPNLKGWGLRVFCQPGYPCLTVLRLQTAITGKFILFTLVIQRNINHSACTPTEQLYSSTYGDKSRTVSEIELTVTERLWIHLDTDIKKKNNPRKQSFFGDWMKMAILNNFYSLYCMKRKLLTRWFNSGKQIEFLSSRCCKCDYCSLNVCLQRDCDDKTVEQFMFNKYIEQTRTGLSLCKYAGSSVGIELN